ncbi:hypothetical protein Afe04nite_20120 [Asanoa ferruginea]|nr:hypothetical protein Afe04nite_20120 [Asanoa ferruginea]
MLSFRIHAPLQANPLQEEYRTFLLIHGNEVGLRGPDTSRSGSTIALCEGSARRRFGARTPQLLWGCYWLRGRARSVTAQPLGKDPLRQAAPLVNEMA